jgi:hypothetical protein
MSRTNGDAEISHVQPTQTLAAPRCHGDCGIRCQPSYHHGPARKDNISLPVTPPIPSRGRDETNFNLSVPPARRAVRGGVEPVSVLTFDTLVQTMFLIFQPPSRHTACRVEGPAGCQPRERTPTGCEHFCAKKEQFRCLQGCKLAIYSREWGLSDIVAASIFQSPENGIVCAISCLQPHVQAPRTALPKSGIMPTSFASSSISASSEEATDLL